MFKFDPNKALADFSSIANRVRDSNQSLWDNLTLISVFMHGTKALLTDEVSQTLRKNATSRKHVQETELLLEAAKKHNSTGAVSLIKQCIVSMYSILEFLVEDIAKCIFMYSKELMSLKDLKKATMTFEQAMNYSEEDVLNHFFVKYKESAVIGRKYGYERLDCLLCPLDINIKPLLNKEEKNLISELAQIRNVIVHSGGVIDQQFISLFPNSNFIIGTDVNVDTELFTKYTKVAMKFNTSVLSCVWSEYFPDNKYNGRIAI